MSESSGISAVVHELRHSPFPVVAVIAPAGYGKTALLTQWAAAEERNTAWATITTDDDDPALLLAELTAAFAQVSESVAQRSSAAVDAVAAPHRGAMSLATALRQTSDPFVVFVDDVQAAADPACEEILATVLTAVPPGSAVALASRRSLPFLARQRVERRVRQVGVRHLRLDLAGARRIAEESGVNPSDAELEEWLRRCDGWPTGLILSVLAFRDGRERLRGGDQDVVDYLSRQCVTELPEKLIVFLTRTSVLSRLSVASCNAILESADAAWKLRELRERHLFLITTDTGELRCPELIREYLLEELLAREPDEAVRLHARAVDWYEEHGEFLPAIEHSIRSGDRSRASELIARHGLALCRKGDATALDYWIRQLGHRALARSPWTAGVAVWAALHRGHIPDAHHRLNLLEHAEGEASEAGGAAVRPQHAMFRTALRAVRTAAELVAAPASISTAGESPERAWLDHALHLHGRLLTPTGNPGSTLAFQRAASRVPRLDPAVEITLLSECDLAWLAIANDDWAAAAEHTRAALRLVADHGLDDHALSAIPAALGARVAVQNGDPRAADLLLSRGMRLRDRVPRLQPVLAVQIRLHLAHAWLRRGDTREAHALLDEVDALSAIDAPSGALTDEAEALRNRLRTQISDPRRPTLTPAEMRLIPLLQSHLTLAQIGELLFVSRNTVNTQTGAVYRKLGVRTRKEAVEASIRLGLLNDGPTAGSRSDLRLAPVPQPPSSRNGATGSIPS